MIEQASSDLFFFFFGGGGVRGGGCACFFACNEFVLGVRGEEGGGRRDGGFVSFCAVF